MSKSPKLYDAALLRQFDRLTASLHSNDNLTRITARLDLKVFTERHGKDVCDAMFAELQRHDKRTKGA